MTLIERSVLLESGPTIKQIHLPTPKTAINGDGEPIFRLVTIEENERQHIFDTLNYCGGRITGVGPPKSWAYRLPHCIPE